jgi:Tol biopolymer transport system component
MVQRGVLLVALAVFLVLVSAIGPATAHAAFPGANGKIAFHSTRDGNAEIYLMNADGSSQTRLTNNQFQDQRAAWSPDGTKIAFDSYRDGDVEVFVMNADGTGETQITNNTTAHDSDPAWSPDGAKIAFASDRDNGSSYEIYVMNADGSAQTRLTSNFDWDRNPVWSPDGSKIAFGGLRVTLGGEIYVMNADGTGETRIGSEDGGGPAWSPDGARLAFHSCRLEGCHETTTQWEVYTMNPDGSNETQLTSSPSYDASPAWSPDGSKIAFRSNRDGNAEIYTMNADGTSQTRLTNDAATDNSPDWQPVAVPGGYPRPAGATPVRVSLVPAFQQCTGANRAHGTPLAFPSCNPPTQESSRLTVGANSSGFARYSVTVGVPGGVDDADVRFTFRLTDVRHQDTLADYTGELQVVSVVRITDRLGGPANEPATVTDLDHELTAPCAATGGEAGATCSVTTTFDAVVPGTIREGRRAVWQQGQVRVDDGGPDGLAATSPNTPFAVQGVFVP